jgi:hypothetical protein
MAFAKLKAHLRRIGAQSTISGAPSANICDLYTPE